MSTPPNIPVAVWHTLLFTYFTTTIRPRFDCNSTALRLFDDLRYDRTAALRHKQINRSAWLRLAGYGTVTLMTFDKQSNGSRTAVESKTNHSCKHRIADDSPRDDIDHVTWPISASAATTFTSLRHRQWGEATSFHLFRSCTARFRLCCRDLTHNLSIPGTKSTAACERQLEIYHLYLCCRASVTTGSPARSMWEVERAKHFRRAFSGVYQFVK